MTTTLRMTAPKRVPMDSMRKTALVAGVFYLIPFISIPRPREACRDTFSAKVPAAAGGLAGISLRQRVSRCVTGDQLLPVSGSLGR
jgi:hypothetical protein